MPVKEHPMLFSGEMVRATLRDVDPKTQTRRIPNKQNSVCPAGLDNLNLAEAVLEPPSLFCPDTPYLKAPHKTEDTRHRIFPRYQPGDRIWVRETFWKDKREPDSCVIYAHDPRYYKYKNTGVIGRCCHEDFARTNCTLEEAEKAVETNKHWKKCPSIFMPRWASRTLLEVVSVRVERVQEISEADCIAEGIRPLGPEHAPSILRNEFRNLWDSINGKKHPWADNPWVWAIEFKRDDA